MTSRAPLLLVFATAMAAYMLSAPSRADSTKDQCVDANAKAQDLRRDGKLAAARAELSRCVDTACPELVRNDCTRRLDELDRVQPSLVFDLKNSAGADLIDVRVTMDGQLLVDRLDGRATKVDPGAHEFRFEAPGQPAVAARFLIREGEIGRRERIVVGNVPAPAPVPVGPPFPGAVQTPGYPQTAAAQQTIPPPPAAEPAPSHSGLGSRKPLALLLAGGGVVALGIGTAFGLMASSAWSDAKAACGGDTARCMNVAAANDHKSTTQTDGAVSTVAFIGGGLLVAAGAVVYLTDSRSEKGRTASLTLAPTLGLGRAGVALEGVLP
jgi:hypothetical protein